jgi:hypothetical protein
MDTNSHIIQFVKANPGQAVPSNHGKPWKLSETQKLLDNVQRKLSNAEIALAHGRTEGSIYSRLRDMAYKMYEQGDNISDILRKTGLTDEELNNKIQYMQSYKSTKKQSIPTAYATVDERRWLDAVKETENIIAEQMSDKIQIQLNNYKTKLTPKTKVKLDDNTYNELLADYKEMQSDIAEIKSDIKRIFELLKGLELA